MPLYSKIAGNRVEITARTLASTLRISEFRLESDSAHLLLLSAGEAEIIQGEKTLPVPAPGLVWLPIGPAGRLRLNAGSRGSLLRTSEIGLAHAMPTGMSASAVRNILQRVLTQVPAEKDRQELAVISRPSPVKMSARQPVRTRSSPACSPSRSSASASTPSPILPQPSPRPAALLNGSSCWSASTNAINGAWKIMRGNSASTANALDLRCARRQGFRHRPIFTANCYPKRVIFF